MSSLAPRSTAVFRACVVNAVKEGETLMGQLIRSTRSELSEAEQRATGIQERMHISDALRALDQQESMLLKSYPMALLETFADGPGASKTRVALDTGIDFGELTLVDDSEVMAQVELSRAQQIASHATDAALAELNTFVSSAQGLSNVQPERNPLRPENYIRALQRAVDDSHVSKETRQLWMESMRQILGVELTSTYRRVTDSLREHGVPPVGYVVAPVPGSHRRASNGGSHAGYAGESHFDGSARTGRGNLGHRHQASGTNEHGFAPSDFASAGHMGHTNWHATGLMPIGGGADPGVSSQEQEALLTVGVLRQMLAAGGDPFAYDPLQVQGFAQTNHGAPVGGAAVPHHLHAVPAAAQTGFSSSQAAEAMEDMAQLERLVGRLSGQVHGTQHARHDAQPGASVYQSVPSSQSSGGWHDGHSVQGILSNYGGLSSRSATEVLSRMMEHISQDSRLLPPVQRAVQNLEPALKHLVRNDPSFFSNELHPARRLLDELTERSLSFEAEDSKGFQKYIQLVNAAVQHLSTVPVHDAKAFEHVSDALESAWNTQVQRLRKQQEGTQDELLQIEKREMLAQRLAREFANLPEAHDVPGDILEFVTGVWAMIVARAQCDAERKGAARDSDPHGYLALVPMLLKCAQRDLAPEDAQLLLPLMEGMLVTLRNGLLTAAQSDLGTLSISETLLRMTDLQLQVAQRATDSAHAQPVDFPLEPEPLPPIVVPQALVPETVAELDIDVSKPEPELRAPFEVPVEAPVEVLAAVAEPKVEIVAASVSQEPVEPVVVAAATTAVLGADTGAGIELGQWIELTTNQRTVKTQLTWVSPHNTLFLFTGLDASTQSMTRRMLEKLSAEGMIRKIGDQRVVARALGAVKSERRAGPPSTRPGSKAA